MSFSLPRFRRRARKLNCSADRRIISYVSKSYEGRSAFAQCCTPELTMTLPRAAQQKCATACNVAFRDEDRIKASIWPIFACVSLNSDSDSKKMTKE